MIPLAIFFTVFTLALILRYFFGSESSDKKHLDLVVVLVSVYGYGCVLVILATNYMKNYPTWTTVISTIAFIGMHCGFVMEV